MVSIGALARRFALAGDLVLSTLEPRMGTAVKGRLEAGLLFTPAYIARLKAQVQGAHPGAHREPTRAARMARDASQIAGGGAGSL